VRACKVEWGGLQTGVNVRAGIVSIAATLIGFSVGAAGQVRPETGEKLRSVAAFPMRMVGPVLRQGVQMGQPFTVAGPQGVVLGQQHGVFEAWVLPVKLLSHFTVEAQVEGYPVPLDVNTMAREIEVRPDRTVITYSHIALTVRQVMFAPEGMADGTGAVVLFQVDSIKPVELTMRFTAEMREMWPKPGSGNASPEWVPRGTSGFYLLHTDYRGLSGAVALPGATPGIMTPYQERPQVRATEFHLHIDPKTDKGRVFPLLMAVGRTDSTATIAALEAKLNTIDERLPELYAGHAARIAADAAARTWIVTPDTGLDADVAWAEVSIGQLRAKAPDGEVGLVAGYYASGDSARPGFGWFFGRDALYTLYAVNSYGDFELAKQELEFLLKRQRGDGKIMHEYSQTAGEMDWSQFPYLYAAADATPLFLTTVLDYVRTSGDTAFLQAHRVEVMKAWEFETTHDADRDGIYDNAQGTGWVESWPPGMPKQEIYLALLDEQASRAVSELAGLLGEQKLESDAKTRAEKIHRTIEREYYEEGADLYAFSEDNGKVDQTRTVFASVAWWNTGGPGLEHAGKSLRAWASSDIDSDWGARDVAESDPMYDPISYHQGSVWPLFTGWAAMAQYRTGHNLAGYVSTMQNADQTTAQDLGAVTELLSGAFFEPFGRSTSHQLWSSAMVLTPVLRGMFGIEVHGLEHTVRVTPRLPADWPEAEVKQLHVGASVVNLKYRREGIAMVVSAEQVAGATVELAGAGNDGLLRAPLPPVEVSIGHGLPLPGSRTGQLKVVDEVHEAGALRLVVEGAAGSTAMLKVRRNDARARVRVEGGELLEDDVVLKLTGARQGVTLRW